MTIGKTYKFKYSPELLIYIGKNFSGNGYWHQFEKADNRGTVWCELLDHDLKMIEEVSA
jgi:hypothetical protein